MPDRMRSSFPILLSAGIGIFGFVAGVFRYTRYLAEPPKPKPYKRPW